MSKSKFKHYAIKTSENFLAKDSRTNCLEIYEDELSADRVVKRSSQEISVVPCYVYTEKEHAVFSEMYEMLERMVEDGVFYHGDETEVLELLELLAKARGEV